MRETLHNPQYPMLRRTGQDEASRPSLWLSACLSRNLEQVAGEAGTRVIQVTTLACWGHRPRTPGLTTSNRKLTLYRTCQVWGRHWGLIQAVHLGPGRPAHGLSAPYTRYGLSPKPCPASFCTHAQTPLSTTSQESIPASPRARPLCSHSQGSPSSRNLRLSP